VPKRSRFRVAIAVTRFDDILDDKPTAAKTAEQFLPSVQVLQRPAFPMERILTFRGERPGSIVRFHNGVAMAAGTHAPLQVGGLFVLADVNAPGRGNARNFQVNLSYVRQITCADRLDDHIKTRISKHWQVVHRALDDAEFETAVGRDQLISGKHFRTNVDHCYLGADGREQRSVPAATSGKTEHAFAGQIPAQPSAVVDKLPRIRKLLFAG
jgi:hypothetical protein